MSKEHPVPTIATPMMGQTIPNRLVCVTNLTNQITLKHPCLRGFTASRYLICLLTLPFVHHVQLEDLSLDVIQVVIHPHNTVALSVVRRILQTGSYRFWWTGDDTVHSKNGGRAT
jgi:hypothetical protein